MLRWLVVLGLGLSVNAAHAQASNSALDRSDPFVRSLTKPWTGDFDGMAKRRVIRVLTVYSKTLYFIEGGAQRGIAYDSMKRFEEEINRRIKDKNHRIEVAFVPVSREELLPALIKGRGDIVVANLTITPQRRRLVDFTQPWIDDVSEIVVTGPASPRIASLDQLAGRDVFVRRSSSYYEHLVALNARFARERKPVVKLTAAPESLEDEDLLEMLNGGLIKYAVIDSYKAELWQAIFPKLIVHPDIAVHSDGEIAWAVRKNSPLLKAKANAFLAKNGRKSVLANENLRRYFKTTRYVKSATADAELKKFQALSGLFRKYGDRYDLDWMLIAAQGYQESRLDHSARSRAGAVGVMQVMPATGRALDVGDIRQVEPNVHAGVKYVRVMLDRYYKDEPMDDLNRQLFTFAAYNSGPSRVASLRREASKRRLNPNVWFDNVERVAAAQGGRETVTYVGNIFKYYVAYAMVEGEYRERIEAKRRLIAEVRPR